MAVALGSAACASSLQRTTNVGAAGSPGSGGGAALRGGAGTGAAGSNAATRKARGTTGTAFAQGRGGAPGETTGPGGHDSSSASTPGGGAPGRRGLSTGRGITADTVKVGVVVMDWAGLQNVEGYNTGDPRIQARAIAEYINARGGVRGRTLELVFEEMSAASANIEADEQRMCAAFTEDHKVFAAVAGMMTLGKTMVPCLVRHDTVFVHGAGAVHDDTYLADVRPYVYYPGGPSLSRMARFYVDGVAEQGFFAGDGATGDTRVGLVRVDDAPFARVTKQVLKPRLAKLGVQLVEEAAVQAQDSLGDTATQMSNVTLRFQQRGINRVLFLDNAQLATLFAVQASQTGYYPRYALNTTTIPNTIQNNVPARALQGAVGVGWQPPIDVNRAYEKVTPAADVCYTIMAAAGQSGVDRSGEWQQRNFCDELLFLDFALERADALTPAGVARAVAGLGTSFRSALNWQTDFTGGRPDGAATVRFFQFVDGCGCFKYVSPVRRVG